MMSKRNRKVMSIVSNISDLKRGKDTSLDESLNRNEISSIIETPKKSNPRRGMKVLSVSVERKNHRSSCYSCYAINKIQRKTVRFCMRCRRPVCATHSDKRNKAEKEFICIGDAADTCIQYANWNCGIQKFPNQILIEPGFLKVLLTAFVFCNCIFWYWH